LVLLLSELQWADELVLHLVERLLIRLRSLPFVVLGTSLPDARSHARVDAGRANLTVVGVDPLDEKSVHALAAALLGDDVGLRLAAALHERTGGNPFFVEELAAVLRESPRHSPILSPSSRRVAFPQRCRDSWPRVSTRWAPTRGRCSRTARSSGRAARPPRCMRSQRR